MSATSTLRPGSWELNGGTGAIYDLTFTNDGTCPAIDIGINLGLPEDSELVSFCLHYIYNLKFIIIIYFIY